MVKRGQNHNSSTCEVLVSKFGFVQSYNTSALNRIHPGARTRLDQKRIGVSANPDVEMDEKPAAL
jgi:hypothetical protein